MAWHFLFETLAYVVAFRLYIRARDTNGDFLNSAARWRIVVAAVLGAALGSRLLFWFEDPQLTFSHWNDLAYLLSGKTIVGALLGGTVAVEVTKWRFGIRERTGDLFAIPLAVGIAIGRIGCLLAGKADDTYGTATSLPWGIDLGDGVPRHPVQLYEVIAMAVLAAALARISAPRFTRGDRYRVFLISYFLWRLLVDFLKAAPRCGGLTTLQWASAAALVWYAKDAWRIAGEWGAERKGWFMADRVRPYLFYDTAISICSTCYRRAEGKIVFEDGCVYLLKRCPVHGPERVLMADDVDYYRRCREVFIKPPEMPNRYNMPVRWDCPYDCGLCTDHEQHSCLTLLEITDHCNLECPICYASSGPSRARYRSMEQIETMLDAIVRNEGKPDVVQISGGEPTLHPDFFRVLDAARSRPIQHLMVNTNGIRIARDVEFAERLAEYMPGFEIYLQFDSFEAAALKELRGADLTSIRRQAIERLNRLGVSTSLVVTLKRGLNDGEIGKIIDWAIEQPCVRGVVLQPIQAAGRQEQFDSARDRLTLTEVRRKILEQTKLFRPEDVIPVPCHPDSLAMAYALKLGGKVIPLTGMLDPKVLIEGGRNTIVYENDEALQKQIFKLFSTNHSPKSSASTLRELLCCLPKILAPAQIDYSNVFRVIIMQFIDAWSFDVRSVKKTCVHIAHPDGKRIIPFDTYNLFYRDELEASILDPLRREREWPRPATRESNLMQIAERV